MWISNTPNWLHIHMIYISSMCCVYSCNSLCKCVKLCACVCGYGTARQHIQNVSIIWTNVLMSATKLRARVCVCEFSFLSRFPKIFIFRIYYTNKLCMYDFIWKYLFHGVIATLSKNRIIRVWILCYIYIFFFIRLLIGSLALASFPFQSHTCSL